ncbi:MAG: cellulase family glycosylhydrolase [Eubacterium sp.]|nr:cellulase family glycosylhydrolase [Eubacterium sp.]
MKKLIGYQRGINFGGWLSQCDHEKETYDNKITENDFQIVSDWCLDHVRIPIDYNLLENEDGSYKTENLIYIDNAVKWCGKYGLNMILDLHSTYGYSFDDYDEGGLFFSNLDYQERFYQLWEMLASLYGSNSDMLVFELLNEVTDEAYSDSWNAIILECIKRIRKKAPGIQIMFGGYHNNGIDALKDLVRPDDDNIIYTFHCYEPLIFTHQGAYWVPTMDESFRISISATYGEMMEATEKYMDQATVGLDDVDPSDGFSEKYYEKIFADAVKIADERNVALYCGEYGVIDLAAPDEILNWYKTIHKVFDKYGIGRAAWTYRGLDFGFVDEHMQPVLDEVLRYL